MIEDCQVPIDNTTYTDWLAEQGIPFNDAKQDIFVVDNSELNVDVVHKKPMPLATDEVKRKVEKPDKKDMNIKPSDNKQDANKDVKDEKKEGDEVPFKAQELVNEYLQKFKGDLNAFLATCSSEEETMETI